MKTFKVALDGPSGAGKSTIAKAAAERFNLVYIDTGAMYRSVGLFAILNGVIPSDGEAVDKIIDKIDIDIRYLNGVQHIFLCGEDVNDKIRTPQISMAASDVGKIASVRKKLVELQQNLAEKKPVIMDGRDIGSRVLPNAQVKIFLTADAEARAKRRYAELKEKGETVSLEQVLEDMKLRDYNDSHREISPLTKTRDAVTVDTTNLTLEESIEAVCKIISERQKQ